MIDSVLNEAIAALAAVLLLLVGLLVIAVVTWAIAAARAAWRFACWVVREACRG